MSSTIVKKRPWDKASKRRARHMINELINEIKEKEKTNFLLSQDSHFIPTGIN